jgi:cytochrome c
VSWVGDSLTVETADSDSVNPGSNLKSLRICSFLARRVSFFGCSVIVASVVTIRPAIDAASSRAVPDRRASLACSTFLILLSSSAMPQEPARAGADAGSGQLIFNNACRTCHTTKEGDNRLGPNLHNIIGRKVGSLPNFGYSSAMKGADFVWDTGKLDSSIVKPDEVVPGNNMKPYGELASAEDRTKLIAFLQSATD